MRQICTCGWTDDSLFSRKICFLGGMLFREFPTFFIALNAAKKMVVQRAARIILFRSKTQINENNIKTVFFIL